MRDGATDDDLRFMQAALALGRRSMGQAAPNPAVGALVVKNGIVIGRGGTAPGGRPHAEPLALAEAGEAARDATLYVTLEPCSHVGRTPPCVEAVLASGLSRVVVAMADPDPRVSGRGLARLRDAGVAVTAGVCEQAAHDDHRGHILRVTAGRPLVTVKMAETADGFAAGRPGQDRLLITGPAANAQVHLLRARHDALMVGAGTAREDNPLLTVRLPGFTGRQPIRVVLDPRLTLPARSRLAVSTEDGPVWVVATEEASGAAAATLAASGVKVLRLPAVAGRLDLTGVLSALAGHGVTRILCEGGPTLSSALVEVGLADRVVLVTDPRRLGREGRLSLTPDARARLLDRHRYGQVDATDWGPDQVRTYRKVEACSLDS